MAIRVKTKPGAGITYQVGTQVAVVQSLIVLGTHESNYPDRNGNKQMKTRASIRFELPDSTYTTQDGETRCQNISSSYTLTLNEKSSLYPVVTAAINRKLTKEEQLDFPDLSSIVGKNLFIVIEKDAESGKYEIASYAPIPASMPTRALSTQPVVFDFEPDANGKINLPEHVADWVKEEIISSEEYQEYLQNAEKGVKPAPKAATPLPTVSTAPAAAVEAQKLVAAGLSPVPQAQTAATAAASGLPDLTNVPDHMKETVIKYWMEMEAAKQAAANAAAK